MILLNPVIIAVLVMIILCLCKLNVLVAIIISAIVAGLTAGMDLSHTMSVLIDGMGGNSETALSYILLGALAVIISDSGLATIIAVKISKIVKTKKYLLMLILVLISCSSQNLIPVHIAFIPILVPPLLGLMNKLKIDRRAIACCLTFGLKAPYIVLPVGFGLIFQTIIRDQLTANGVNVTLHDIVGINWVLGLGMLCGLLTAIFISYRKPREYQTKDIEKTYNEWEKDIKFEVKHWFALIGAIIAFVVQVLTGSLPLGALVAIIFMLCTKVVSFKDLDPTIDGGIRLMGFIAFIMLVAAGFGNVIRETGAINELVNGIISVIGTSKVIGGTVMLLVGLIVTMGIGTSFGTIPILAVIYCPLALKLGFSPVAIALLVAAAGALGDAGSPASDSTLGPTAGLDMDGQHDHIYDTCVPTFLHYNIPLVLFGLVGALLVS